MYGKGEDTRKRKSGRNKRLVLYFGYKSAKYTKGDKSCVVWRREKSLFSGKGEKNISRVLRMTDTDMKENSVSGNREQRG